MKPSAAQRAGLLAYVSLNCNLPQFVSFLIVVVIKLLRGSVTRVYFFSTVSPSKLNMMLAIEEVHTQEDVVYTLLSASLHLFAFRVVIDPEEPKYERGTPFLSHFSRSTFGWTEMSAMNKLRRSQSKKRAHKNICHYRIFSSHFL